MSLKYENLKFFEHLIADSTATGDKASFIIPYKCRVYRAQIVQSVSEGTACTVKFDLQPTAGSATSRGDGDIAQISFPASDKQGYCYYDLVAKGTILNEGDAVVVEVTTGSTGDKGLYCQLLYDYIPEAPGNNAAMVETA